MSLSNMMQLSCVQPKHTNSALKEGRKVLRGIHSSPLISCILNTGYKVNSYQYILCYIISEESIQSKNILLIIIQIFYNKIMFILQLVMGP